MNVEQRFNTVLEKQSPRDGVEKGKRYFQQNSVLIVTLVRLLAAVTVVCSLAQLISFSGMPVYIE